jgi:hypothetical protein
MEFMRQEWSCPKIFRLADQAPEFDVGGLWWRYPAEIKDITPAKARGE